MAERPDTGIFLERRSYRRRRLIDGLKLLPFLGAWLFLLPAFWPEGETGTMQSMSGALYFIFGVWFALIAACAALVLAVRRLDNRGATDRDERSGTP
jgi:hypothetical protein